MLAISTVKNLADIFFSQSYKRGLIANSRIMVPGQYACTGQQGLQTQNLNSIVRTRRKS